MIVLFEGVDKSGKSSLLQYLTAMLPEAVQLKNPYKPTIHTPDFIAGVYAGLYYSLHGHSAHREAMYFLDRSHITEIVYGKVLRHYNANQVFDWPQYEESHHLSIAVIYMSAPLETLRQRWHTEKEDYLPLNKLESVLAAYQSYLTNSSLPQLCLSSIDPMDDNIKHAINFFTQIKNT